jgi:RNA polymerase sigma factor (sigma-70 family)
MTQPHTEEDAALFRRARTSPDAFAELYRAYAPAVYSWFRRRTAADPETAADLTAEVFARAIVGIHRFRGTRPGAGTAWLFAIVRNLAIDYARTQAVEARARRRLQLPVGAYEPDRTEDMAIRLDAEAAGAEIMKAFERLSEPQRTAITLRVIDELSYGEIVARNGSTEQAARLHVLRGLRRLRQLVAPPAKGS